MFSPGRTSGARTQTNRSEPDLPMVVEQTTMDPTWLKLELRVFCHISSHIIKRQGRFRTDMGTDLRRTGRRFRSIWAEIWFDKGKDSLRFGQASPTIWADLHRSPDKFVVSFDCGPDFLVFPLHRPLLAANCGNRS
jgi:hypothetical protein